MQTKLFLITIFLLHAVFCFSQKTHVPLSKAISGDCENAIPIVLNNSYTYGPTLAPKGFGELQEFKTNNSLTFEGEHNSAWYLLSIAKNGVLTFDLVPLDSANDYDFLLYRYTDSTFCDSLYKNKLKPLRSNLSNIKKSIKGITGLKSNALKNTINKGVGAAYSKSVDVKKGEKYMLILDNVTPQGSGCTLFFNFIKEVEIIGRVLGSDSIPLIADISLSDKNGKTIEETKSNSNGEYKINTQLNENQNYNLTYLADNSFVQSVTINTKDMNGNTKFPEINTILPKLKKGEKYKLGNINFYGNNAILLPESFSSVESLYKLMKKNSKMNISIQGHVNDPQKKISEKYHVFDQHISEERAKAIFDFLLSKGINKERMKTEGFSNTQMLYPNPKNEAEQSANRRVEIKVLSIE